MTLWYFVGTACVLGVLLAVGTISFLILLAFHNYLAWDWILQPVLTRTIS